MSNSKLADVVAVAGAAAYLGYKAFEWFTGAGAGAGADAGAGAGDDDIGDQDTSHGRFYGSEDLPLSKQLVRYHEYRVKLDAQQEKHAKELVHEYIEAIVKSVKGQIDQGKPWMANNCRIEYTGSMYEGTKWGQPDEFDIMIVIDGSQDIEGEEVTPGYSRLRASQYLLSTHRFSRCLDRDNNISPRKMADWFSGLVQKGVNQVACLGHDSVWLGVSRHGPAIQVDIRERSGLFISVDLVLCIQLGPQQLFVAKPYKEYADEPPDWRLRCDPAMLWRQSFSVIETRSISRIDGANECRRDCLRILKSIFGKEPGLEKFTSYHLKTVLMHECQSQGSWQIRRIDERFMDLLKRIESCLRAKSLPHFYLPNLNLLDGIRHVTIDNMRGRVQRLINSKVQRDSVLHC